MMRVRSQKNVTAHIATRKDIDWRSTHLAVKLFLKRKSIKRCVELFKKKSKNFKVAVLHAHGLEPGKKGRKKRKPILVLQRLQVEEVDSGLDK